MPTTEIPEKPTLLNPARLPRKPPTEEEVKALAETLALPEINQNIGAATAYLQKRFPDHGYNRWYRVLKSSEYMSAMHPSTKPEEAVPDQIDTINRTPLLTQPEQREIVEMVKQEKLLATGDWEKIGIPKERAEQMVSLEKFAKLPMVHMARATHGSLMKSFEGLNAVYDKYINKLLSDELPEEYDKKGEPKDSQREWLYALVATTAEIRQIKAQVDKSMLMMLKAEALERELRRAQNPASKKQRLGAAPLVAIKADAGSTVTIHESKREE